MFAIWVSLSASAFADPVYTKDQNGNIIKSETLTQFQADVVVSSNSIEIDQFNSRIATLQNQINELIAQRDKKAVENTTIKAAK